MTYVNYLPRTNTRKHLIIISHEEEEEEEDGDDYTSSPLLH